MRRLLSQIETNYNLLNKNYKILAIAGLFFVVFIIWYLLISQSLDQADITKKNISQTKKPDRKARLRRSGHGIVLAVTEGDFEIFPLLRLLLRYHRVRIKTSPANVTNVVGEFLCAYVESNHNLELRRPTL